MIERAKKEAARTPVASGTGSGERDEYINAEDLFYWMEETCGAEIPLTALWIDIPTGCRFCC